MAAHQEAILLQPPLQGRQEATALPQVQEAAPGALREVHQADLRVDRPEAEVADNPPQVLNILISKILQNEKDSFFTSIALHSNGRSFSSK